MNQAEAPNPRQYLVPDNAQIFDVMISNSEIIQRFDQSHVLVDTQNSVSSFPIRAG
jgi:hypothetical protein